MEKLGCMKRIDDLRSIWPHEEQDFSKWLAQKENLEQLSDAIEIDLELEETESPVGSFSVDIYARESGSSRGIIIENQLKIPTMIIWEKSLRMRQGKTLKL